MTALSYEIEVTGHYYSVVPKTVIAPCRILEKQVTVKLRVDMRLPIVYPRLAHAHRNPAHTFTFQGAAQPGVPLPLPVVVPRVALVVLPQPHRRKVVPRAHTRLELVVGAKQDPLGYSRRLAGVDDLVYDVRVLREPEPVTPRKIYNLVAVDPIRALANNVHRPHERAVPIKTTKGVTKLLVILL